MQGHPMTSPLSATELVVLADRLKTSQGRLRTIRGTASESLQSLTFTWGGKNQRHSRQASDILIGNENGRISQDDVPVQLTMSLVNESSLLSPKQEQP